MADQGIDIDEEDETDEFDENFYKMSSVTDEVMKAKERNPGMFVSHWEEDENDIQGWTEEEIRNDPSKQFIIAAENNDLEAVKRLLCQNPSLISSRDNDQYSALHRAAYSGHQEMVELLLLHGASLTATSVDGWTPLHSASFWNNAAVVDLLLRAGADANARTNGGQTPLHLSASHNDTPETLQLLLFHSKTQVWERNQMGETAYDLCQRSARHADLFHCRGLSCSRLKPEE